jgi:hypothetical protein
MAGIYAGEDSGFEVTGKMKNRLIVFGKRASAKENPHFCGLQHHHS